MSGEDSSGGLSGLYRACEITVALGKLCAKGSAIGPNDPGRSGPAPVRWTVHRLRDRPAGIFLFFDLISKGVRGRSPRAPSSAALSNALGER
jgi:hypothetical protein